MKIRVADTAPRGSAARRFAFLHEARNPGAGTPRAVRKALTEACRSVGFRGRARETAGVAASDGWWSLVGLGRAPASLGRLRRAIHSALRDALRFSAGRLVLAFDEGIDATTLRALLSEIALADYVFGRYKTRERPRLSASATILPPEGVDAAELRRIARRAEVIARSVAWARDLGNTPANDLGPEDFAREARALFDGSGVSVRALKKREIEREQMGGLLAVNSGSVRPPVFLIGEYRPPSSRGTVVLVGKGITFDSGGISIKPALAMGEMKYDMMGAATAFASLAAARDLDLPVTIVALAPLTENLPSGSACRPGDILRMRNGKTVEVENTDAEGRLVLADALSYAEKFRPDVLLDYATLTGAVLIALGHECAALMTSDEELSRDLVSAGEATGERLWRLPLWDDYRENLRSEWADMKNTGGRPAGTINAAVFLKEFVPSGVSWAHIDVAGVAHFEKEHAGFGAGATGFGVALTIEFLRRRFGERTGAVKRKA